MEVAFSIKLSQYLELHISRTVTIMYLTVIASINNKVHTTECSKQKYKWKIKIMINHRRMAVIMLTYTLSPFDPCLPASPDAPLGPLLPLGPRWPGGPRSPWGPGKPGPPGFPSLPGFPYGEVAYDSNLFKTATYGWLV